MRKWNHRIIRWDLYMHRSNRFFYTTVKQAQKNQWPQAKKSLNLSQAIMFDHKIPKALIEAGYADEIEYIKSSAWWWNVQWGKILGVSWNGDFAIEKLASKFFSSSGSPFVPGHFTIVIKSCWRSPSFLGRLSSYLV